MNQNNQPFFWLAIIVLIFIAGCDGNDVPIFGSGQSEQKGRFLDSAVENLDYSSATRAGTTDFKGQFSYQEGESVTFAVGNITLGTATGQAIITPVNLVPGGDTSTPEVQNITRFLLALDQDDDPRNGITVSPAVRSAAESWSAVDFSASDFAAQVNGIITEAGSIDGRTITLPDAEEAEEHLENTLFCAYGGAYSGTYSGTSGNSGEWMASVAPEDGAIRGFLNDSSGADFLLIGQINVSSPSTFMAEAIPGNTINRWQGTISSSGTVTADSGNVQGRKKTIELPADTRGDIYKGVLTKGNRDIITNIYAIAFAIDGENITGKAYSMLDKTYIDTRPELVNGNKILFYLNDIQLFGGNINTGNHISIANGQENIYGTACRTP